jgi:hypothetical protein
MKTKYLSRAGYLKSVLKLSHFDTLKFAKQAMLWWDDYYSWDAFPPLCLIKNKKVVCYLFYTVSKNKDYLTIHNILTPKKSRNKGYAKEILRVLFDERLIKQHIKRVKMLCVSSSVSFYMKLGVDFWGVNKLGQYYTNFPMPKNIKDIPNMMKNNHLSTLNQDELKSIFDKLKHSDKDFNEKEKEIYQNNKSIMKDRYRFEELKEMVE